MEHIPAIHAAKVGMRYPARVVLVREIGLQLKLDLAMVAPGRNPQLTASLQFNRTVGASSARELREGDVVEVVVINKFDMFGSPPSIHTSLPANPAWLTWNNGTVRQLAQRIRESDETVLLPVLADALEEAGCTDNLILDRCRRPEDDDLRWLVTLLATQE